MCTFMIAPLLISAGYLPISSPLILGQIQPGIGIHGCLDTLNVFHAELSENCGDGVLSSIKML